MDPFRAANLANWNERAALHATDTTGMYRIDAVIAGHPVLHSVEAAELGPVGGLRIAHLQCHIGTDTVSLAHLGAGEVIGLDFSEVAVAAARDLAARAGRPNVSFVQSDVYAARSALAGDFDLVYVTWGAINWLPDIAAWAKVVSSLLKPGGRLFLAESHPVTLCLEETDGRIGPTYDWRTPRDRPLVFDLDTTYTGDARKLVSTRTYEWIHPLSDILTGISDAGLRLQRFCEHDVLPWVLFPSMVPAEFDSEGTPMTWRLPDGVARLPLAFSLNASKTP